MKNLKLNLVVLGLFFSLAGSVQAMEGTANLGSVGGEMGSCFASSIYIEDRYRVLMTCRGLRSALDPVRNIYVAWAKKGENLKNIGEIVNGKLQASMGEDFESIEVTVEEDYDVRKPSGGALLSGKMEAIVFSGIKTAVKEEVLVVSPTPTPVVEKTVSTTGSSLKAIGKALLTGFLVLLLVVGVLSYLSRRKRA